MKEKYKYLFFRKIYKQLQLSGIEEQLESNNIKGIIENKVSKYFTLLNSVYEEQLPEQYLSEYKDLFSLSLEQLRSKEMEDRVNKFIDQTYQYMLFKNIDENYMYYGTTSNDYIAPRDAIVLGIVYEEFGLGEDNFDKEYKKQDDYICDVCNYIQYTLAPKYNKKVAVLRFNEYTVGYLKY